MLACFLTKGKYEGFGAWGFAPRSKSLMYFSSVENLLTGSVLLACAVEMQPACKTQVTRREAPGSTGGWM